MGIEEWGSHIHRQRKETKTVESYRGRHAEREICTIYEYKKSRPENSFPYRERPFSFVNTVEASLHPSTNASVLHCLLSTNRDSIERLRKQVLQRAPLGDLDDSNMSASDQLGFSSRRREAWMLDADRKGISSLRLGAHGRRGSSHSFSSRSIKVRGGSCSWFGEFIMVHG